jgi:hypothetical protein
MAFGTVLSETPRRFAMNSIAEAQLAKLKGLGSDLLVYRPVGGVHQGHLEG